jgi:hypothetical protein
LGTRISLANAVSSILAANPEIIPSSLKEKYERIVDIMASKSKVLATDDANAMLADANEIIKALQSQDESVLDLGIRFANFGNKIMNAKTGEVEYEKTIDDMLSKGEITSEEAELMRKFKKDINSSKLAEEVSKLADQREIELVKLSIDEIKKDLSVDNLAMREERDSAKKLIDGLSDEFINTLTVAEVKQLLNVLDNIANGIYTNTALQMQERAVAFKNSQTLTNAINESKPPTLSYLYAKLKSTFTNKTAVREMIRRVPLYYVSENLGIHSKVLYDTILKNVAKARAAYQVNFGIINKKLENAEVKLAKSFGNNINEFVKSKMKIYAYLVQNEFESNEGNDKLSSVDQHIQTTIDQINRGQSQSYTEAEAEILQGIADNPEYKNQDGSMSAKAMYEAMTPAEKRAIKEIQEVYASLQDKAIYTAAVVRGTPLELFNNYNHLNVSPDMNDVAIVDQTLNEIQNVQSAMNPSTKAKSLITRTRGPKALTFDPFLAASKSSKGILLDYFMTSPIRETRRLMNNVQADMNTTTEDGKFRNELFKGLNDSFEDVVNNVLVNMYTEDSFADRVAQEIKRTGYRAILTSVPRFVSELKSNVGFAVWNPQIFAQGIKLINSVDPHDIISVMLNSGSVNAERLYSSEELSGRMVDSSLLTQKSGLSRNKLRGAALNTAEQFYNNTIKKYKNSVEFVADTLIATPDKLVGRPVWIGAYATKFEEITGKKPDFKMIAENNEQYMEENKDAIEQATDFADRKSIETSASNNEFLGILKGTSTKQQGLLLQTFNQLNNFLSRFTIYEYQAARKSIYAMMGKGEISRAEGVKLLAAVVTRMTSYTLLSKILGGVMADLISKALGKDDDEDKKKKAEKSIKEQTKSAFTSTAIQLILGRDFGNAPRSIINWGIEKANEKYGQQMGLREGKYDPYKDQLGYSPIREGKKGRPKRSTDYLIDFSGAYAPSLQTANFIFDEYNNLSKKKKVTARDLYQLKYRVPLEVLGNAGFVPVYKDIRRAMFEMMPALPTKYQIKGVNKADLKRYFPDLYEQSYGESSSTYEAQQEKKAMDKERRDAIRQAKDEAYGYEGD